MLLLYLSFAPLLRLPRHKRIADAALILTVLHGAGYFIAAPSVWRYLSASAPAYMLAGFGALVAIALLALLSIQRLRRRLARSRLGFRGQHVALAAALLTLTLLHVPGGILVPALAMPSRALATPPTPRLPVRFPHEHHDQVPCLTCHHKVVGMAQTIPCIACHRLPDPAIKLAAEPRFHTFCRSCHAERSRDGAPHGPVRDCNGCHAQS